MGDTLPPPEERARDEVEARNTYSVSLRTGGHKSLPLRVWVPEEPVQAAPAPFLTDAPPMSAPVQVPDRDEPVRQGPEDVMATRHGRVLDPAVMLLYVGALLIVASGIIYAAYNWSDFSAWQKLGALAATTLAFIAAGVLTLSVLVARMLVDVVNALPNWVALLTAGLALLIGGTIWISFRDDVRRRAEAFAER